MTHPTKHVFTGRDPATQAVLNLLRAKFHMIVTACAVINIGMMILGLTCIYLNETGVGLLILLAQGFVYYLGKLALAAARLFDTNELTPQSKLL